MSKTERRLIKQRDEAIEKAALDFMQARSFQQNAQALVQQNKQLDDALSQQRIALQGLQALLESADSMNLDCADLFPDSDKRYVELPKEDFPVALDLAKNFGVHGLVVYMAVKEDLEPLEVWQTGPYKEGMKALTQEAKDKIQGKEPPTPSDPPSDKKKVNGETHPNA